MDEKSLSHTSWNCKYHIVLVPKYRRKVILLAPGDHDHILSGVFNQFLSANPRASRINKKSANNPALID